MGKIFCMEFQRYPLKFHTKYLTHTLKDMILRAHKSFWNAPLVTAFLKHTGRNKFTTILQTGFFRETLEHLVISTTFLPAYGVAPGDMVWYDMWVPITIIRIKIFNYLSHLSLGWLFSVRFRHRNNFCLTHQNRFSSTLDIWHKEYRVVQDSYEGRLKEAWLTGDKSEAPLVVVGWTNVWLNL